MSSTIEYLTDLTILEISSEHGQKFASLPPSIQDKIREKVKRSLQTSHREYLEQNQSQEYQSQSRQSIIPDAFSNMAEWLGVAPDALHDLGIHTPPPPPQEIIEANTPRSSDQSYHSHSQDCSLTVPKKQSLVINEFSEDAKVLPDGAIKLEITSGREAIFQSLGCLTSLGFMILLFSGQFGYSAPALIAAIYFWKSYSKTDDYLLADHNAQMIFYHKQFGKKIETVPHLPFSHIATLSVEGTLNRSKESTWWTYKAVAITRDGEVVELGDSKKTSFAEAKAFVRSLASSLEVNFTEDVREEQVLEVFGSGARLQISFNDGE